MPYPRSHKGKPEEESQWSKDADKFRKNVKTARKVLKQAGLTGKKRPGAAVGKAIGAAIGKKHPESRRGSKD